MEPRLLSVLLAIQMTGSGPYWSAAVADQTPVVRSGPGIRMPSTAAAATPHRSVAVPLDRLSSRQRRHVKREILALLGLGHTPRPTATDRDRAVAVFMMSLYHRTSAEAAVDGATMQVVEANVGALDRHQLDSADTVISFSSQATPSNSSVLNDPTLRRCYFDMRSDVLPTEVVTGAVLRIYKFPAYGGVTSSNDHAHATLLLEVFRLKHDVISDWRRSSDLEASTTVHGQFNGWIDLNVTRSVADWTRSWSRNHGLVIRVTNAETGVALDATTVGFVGDTGPSDKQLFLVAFFKKSPSMTSQPRTRRSASGGAIDDQTSTSRQRGATQRQYADEPVSWPYQGADHHAKKCQRRNLYVSFRDLEWQDWIIAPEGYAAYYCDGECLFPLHAQMNATNHAIVQTLAHLMKPQSVPKPCCAPTKLTAISVLYFDDNSNVILKKYRNMVVRACGCH